MSVLLLGLHSACLVLFLVLFCLCLVWYFFNFILCFSIFLWLYNDNYCPILRSGLRFRVITTSGDFPLLFPLALHESSWASMPLRLSCLAPWSGIRNISHSDPLIDRNIITTYPTILPEVLASAQCSNFHWSPLRCSQNFDHHFCLTTPLRTRQICHSDNSSVNSSLR